MARIRESEAFPGADLVDLHTDALALVDELVLDELNVVIDAADMGLEPGEAALELEGSGLPAQVRGLLVRVVGRLSDLAAQRRVSWKVSRVAVRCSLSLGCVRRPSRSWPHE